MREGADIRIESDIPFDDLDSKADFRIVAFFDQSRQRLRLIVFSLHFDGDKVIMIADKEFFLQCRIFFLIIPEIIPRFHKCFSNDAFKESSLVDIHIFVSSKIHLCIIIELGKKQSAIGIIKNAAVFDHIAFQGKVRSLQSPADIHNAGILKPFECSSVIGQSCP